MPEPLDLRSLLTRTVDLDGDGVRLRAPREDDVPAVAELGSDPQMERWVGVPRPYGDAEATEFLRRTFAQNASGERRTWVMESDGAFAGFAALRLTAAEGVLEVSYAAHPAHRGQGATTAAVRAMASYSFDHGAEALLWHALQGNVASRRVAWRCGFDIAEAAWRPTPPARDTRVEQVWSGILRASDPMRPRHGWVDAPTLELGDLRVRPLTDADAHVLAPGFGPRKSVQEWLLGMRTLPARATRRGVCLVVADAGTDEPLGGVQVFGVGSVMEPGAGEVGYWLRPDARGRGVATRAVDAVVGWALRPAADGGLGLVRLTATCAVPNLASARVLRRAGFTRVGVERDADLVDGVPTDQLRFEVTATDDRSQTRVEPARIPLIETERFRLREWREDDVPRPDEGPDADSLRFMPPRVQPHIATFPAWLRTRQLQRDEGETLNWCVADRMSDHAMGNVLLFRLGPARDRFQGELGYWLHPPARGRGALQEVLPFVVDHALRPVDEGGLGLTRLHAETDLDNAASQALLLRLGFRRWGQDRQAYRNGLGEITDGAYFELLATDDRIDRRPLGGARLAGLALEGRQVRLRPWTDADLPRIVTACSDERSRRWLSRLPEPYTLDDAAAFVRECRQQAAEGGAVHLAVADVGTDECLASVALFHLADGDPTSAEIGYWTHPDARGRGVMTEAVELLVAHAMRPVEAGGLGLRRLEIQSAAGNGASRHVAEATGFTQAGVRRQAAPGSGGAFDDAVVYDLLSPPSSS